MMPSLALVSILMAVALFGLFAMRVPRRLKSVTMAIFALHSLTTYANYTWNLLPQPDATIYQAQAVALANGVEPPLFSAGKEAWPTILSWLYIIGGVHIFVGLFLNCVLAAAVLPIIYLASETMRPGTGRAAVSLLMIMPGWWLWSSTLIREPLVWVLTALICYCLARMSHGETCMVIPITMLCISLAWARGPLAVLLIAGTIAAILLSKGRITARIIPVAFVVLIAAYFAGNQIARIRSIDPSNFETNRIYLAQAGSGYYDRYPAFTFLRVVSAPWPWEIPHLGVLIIPDAVFVWACLAILVMSGKQLGRRYLWLAAPALSVASGIALTTTNYGLLVRLRTTILIMYLPVVAAGIDCLRHRRRDLPLSSKMTSNRHPNLEPIQIRLGESQRSGSAYASDGKRSAASEVRSGRTDPHRVDWGMRSCHSG